MLVLNWAPPAGGNVSGYRIDKSKDYGYVVGKLGDGYRQHGNTTYTDDHPDGERQTMVPGLCPQRPRGERGYPISSSGTNQ